MALVKKNIAGSLLVKGWSCVVQFLIVPLSLNCLSNYEYGLWLVINSILIGIDSIDVGLGNGLRNKLAEAMALGNRDLARKQVSTTFFMLILLIVPLVLVLLVVLSQMDVYGVLNVNPRMVPHLTGILMASVGIMGSTLIFKFVGNMYMGLQLPAVNNLLVVSGQTVALGILFIVSLFGKSDLMTVALIFTLSPLAVYLLAWPISFCGRYKFLAPSLHCFDKASLRPLLSLGLVFFIIQISGLMLFMSSNIIISNVMNPAEVTPYQIAYRYFSIFFMLFTIVATPLWSATTDAYTRGDREWISGVIRKMNRLLVKSIAVLLLMIGFSSMFYALWVGGKVHVDLSLSCTMAVYIYLLVVSNSYSYVLMGIGKIRLSMMLTILSVLVFVPIEYYMCKHFGQMGLLAALIVVTALLARINCVQLNKLLKGKATGIWNK